MKLNYQIEKFERFVNLVERHSPNEGFNLTDIKNLATFKAPTTQERTPVIEIPGIVIVGQGKKICYVGELTNTYSPGHVLVGFYPIPVEMEIVEASPEAPYLLAGLRMDMSRMADVLLRLDRIDKNVAKTKSPDRSSMYSLPINFQKQKSAKKPQSLPLGLKK